MTAPRIPEFVQRIYDANPDVPLPPMHLLTNIVIDISPDALLTVTFTVIGLQLPTIPKGDDA